MCFAGRLSSRWVEETDSLLGMVNTSSLSSTATHTSVSSDDDRINIRSVLNLGEIGGWGVGGKNGFCHWSFWSQHLMMNILKNLTTSKINTTFLSKTNHSRSRIKSSFWSWQECHPISMVTCSLKTVLWRSATFDPRYNGECWKRTQSFPKHQIFRWFIFS